MGRLPSFPALVAGLALGATPVPGADSFAAPAADAPLAAQVAWHPPGTIRIATYNASLNRASEGQLRRELARPGNAQASRIAAVLRQVRPDILLVNEFDHDAAGEGARGFARHYLEHRASDGPLAGLAPLRFAHWYSAPVNTGVPSGLDLDHDGRAGVGAGDALGFGAFPGQYGMVVYSRFPLRAPAVRSFQHLRWAAMPEAALPPGWYDAAALAIQPLSSKSHWDLPVQLPGGRVLHILASHPTPPVFDGPEDRNGRRNHDEIRFWADYLRPERSDWIVDDAGWRGGLESRAGFVILGDLNADPVDGGSYEGAVRQLLEHPRIDASFTPRSRGAVEAAARQAGPNLSQAGEAASDTADFGERGVGAGGNLRADYVLPSRDLAVCHGGVFWPTPADPEFALVNDDTAASSDHRLVWIDVAINGRCRAIDAASRPGPQRNSRSTPTGQ
ncbi:MAG: endonuclease/exonuclease/phosphatase family protein [Steroidobacteraceae bacterium]